MCGLSRRQARELLACETAVVAACMADPANAETLRAAADRALSNSIWAANVRRQP
jgi:hypothetical protein